VGTTHEIGDASYLLSLTGTTVLLDAGLHPRHDGIKSIPDYSAVRDHEVDAITVSHCHLDHLGDLPTAHS
jgi:cleavage and polyadenylation specificity factor subunit 3